MALEIKVLDYGDVELEASFLVLGKDCGRTRRAPVFGMLILGGTWPILVPMNTTVVIRRELEYSVSGLMHPQYPAVDIKHLIDRLHTKGALRFLDLETSGPVELMPGVICEAAGGHTEGSMNIVVKTSEGDANICGDVIYDFNDQIVEPFREIGDMEPRVTGNHGTTKRQEKAAIKKVLARSRFALPIHDWPAIIDGGQVAGRLRDSVPGPVVQSLPRRNWFPA
jgi:glyoxylase-like metal-dependent hydrolase (beta-lactamase superfamily II)